MEIQETISKLSLEQPNNWVSKLRWEEEGSLEVTQEVSGEVIQETTNGVVTQVKINGEAIRVTTSGEAIQVQTNGVE